MTLIKLQHEKVLAMKNKDVIRKNALNAMIDACQKAAITPKGRIEITEDLVNEVLIKYQKTIQEMIDTCPPDREDLLTAYKAEMEVVKEFAPQLMTDTTEIELTIKDIVNGEIELVKANRGKIMKMISPVLKGKADMRIVNEVVGEMLV